MPASVTKKRLKPDKFDLKKLFGTNFQEPTPRDYAATPFVSLQEIVREMNHEIKGGEIISRDEIVGQMKQQVRRMKRQLDLLEKKLSQL